MFAFLGHLFAQRPNVDVSLQILKCLERWLEYVSFPGQIWARNQIFDNVLSCLQSKELFEGCVEVIIALWKCFRCDIPAIVEKTYPHILGLRSIWDSQVQMLTEDSDDDEFHVCRAITRVVTETAEACMEDLVLSDSDHQQMQLLDFLIECSCFSIDFSIARIPHHFFYSLSCVLKESRESHDPKISPHVTSNIRLAFIKYLETAVNRLQIPDDLLSGRVSWSPEREDMRIELTEVAVDCCEAMGSEMCLQTLCSLLMKEANRMRSGENASWAAIEAVLKTIDSIAPYFNDEDSDVISQLIGFIVGLPDILELTRTSISLIGGCSRWLPKNQQFMPSLLPKLLACISQPTICDTTCHTLMNVLKCCSSEVVAVPQLIETMMRLRGDDALPLGCDLKLIEGFEFYTNSFMD